MAGSREGLRTRDPLVTLVTLSITLVTLRKRRGHRRGYAPFASLRGDTGSVESYGAAERAVRVRRFTTEARRGRRTPRHTRDRFLPLQASFRVSSLWVSRACSGATAGPAPHDSRRRCTRRGNEAIPVKPMVA